MNLKQARVRGYGSCWGTLHDVGSKASWIRSAHVEAHYMMLEAKLLESVATPFTWRRKKDSECCGEEICASAGTERSSATCKWGILFTAVSLLEIEDSLNLCEGTVLPFSWGKYRMVGTPRAPTSCGWIRHLCRTPWCQRSPPREPNCLRYLKNMYADLPFCCCDFRMIFVPVYSYVHTEN
jgi:hypothetical protein